MSDSDSTTLTPSGKPAKPAKPYPDFPLFAHAAGVWAKKIRGKLHYFGKWDDWEAALVRYERQKDDLEAGRTPTTPIKTTPLHPKPNKPYADFPLFPHASGQWAKKIRGKMHYFGSWADPDAALQNYLDQKDALHAGRKPRPDADGVTVKDAANAFLNHKQALLNAGELSSHTWTKYKDAADELVAPMGKSRLAVDLDPQDFAGLRERMARKWGLHRLADMIQHIRSICKHAYDAGLIPTPVRFGPGFGQPTKKALRVHRVEQGPNLFTANEIHRLLDLASPTMQAMFLLGINAGFGNADCGNLPLSAVDLDTGWIDYPRPKTGVARRCPLWPETVAALKDALSNRHEPKSEEDAGLVFITKYGERWAKKTEDGPITKETKKLLKTLGINGRKRLGFYTLRHTFRTVADESKDQPAVDHIMGHESTHMSAVYRETISDERLRFVAELVRQWLFTPVKVENPRVELV